MRKKIAERMVLSRRTSAHVHSVFHVDFSHVEKIRRENKAEYARLGARLTYMAFIASAVIDAIRHHPIINASLDGENVIYKKDVHLGIAVALEERADRPGDQPCRREEPSGPESRDCGRRRSCTVEATQAGRGAGRNVHDHQSRASSARSSGCRSSTSRRWRFLASAPSKNGRSLIDDAIAIRTMAYLTLGYDHRLVDGAVADQFMSDVKKHLENFDVDKI